jgi:hypothetical protein
MAADVPSAAAFYGKREKKSKDTTINKTRRLDSTAAICRRC